MVLEIAALTLSHVAVGSAGVYFSPKVEAWFASLSAARALKAANALIADAAAAETKLKAAHALVAKKTVVTAAVTGGATGATGA